MSALFKGEGLYSAGWLMVALKSGTKPRWVLRSIDYVIKFYSDGGTTILPFAPGFSAFTGSFGEVTPVPEPSAMATAFGLLGLISWRERRKSRRSRHQTASF